jgi:hypothetical protein
MAEVKYSLHGGEEIKKIGELKYLTRQYHEDGKIKKVEVVGEFLEDLGEGILLLETALVMKEKKLIKEFYLSRFPHLKETDIDLD